MIKSSRLTIRHYAIALIPALVIRIIFGLAQHGAPVFEKYRSLSNLLLNGQQTTPFSSSPLYTLFIGFLSQTCQLNSDVIRWVQYGLGIISIILVVRITSTIFTANVGTIAGLLFGCSAPVILYESDLVTSSLEIAFVLGAAHCLVSLCKSSNPIHWIGAGFSLGLASCIRPNLLILIPVFAVIYPICIKPRRSAVRGVFLYLLASIVPVVPFTVFNYRTSGELLLITTSGGSVFYSSNNYRAEGLGYSPPQALTQLENDIMRQQSETIPVEHELFKYLAERASGKILNYSETSQFYYDEGMKNLNRSWWNTFGFFLRKFFYFFNNYEVLDTASLIETGYRIHSAFPFIPGFGLISALGLLSIIRPGKRSLSEWILTIFMVPHVVTGIMFYVNGRLRISVAPFLAVFAAFFLEKCWLHYKEKSSDVWIDLFMIMGVFAFVYSENEAIRIHRLEQTPAFHQSMKGLASMKSGRFVDAVDCFETAVLLNPFGVPEAHENLAMLYKMNGDLLRYQAAFRHSSGVWNHDELDRMISRRGEEYSLRFEVQMARAAAFYRENRYQEADEIYSMLLDKTPWNPDVLYNQGVLRLHSGNHTERMASQLIEQALDCGMKLQLHSTAAWKILKDIEEKFGTDPDKLQKIDQQILWEETHPIKLGREHRVITN